VGTTTTHATEDDMSEIVKTDAVEMPDSDTMLKLVGGDLKGLTPPQRVAHYTAVCKSLGMNPLTKPFEYLSLNNKVVLYATRCASDQLRKIHGVSVTISERKKEGDLLIVTARAQTPDGRIDEAIGAVSIGNQRGENLANAYMKAETKAKRRVTLSMCGLGWTDESETHSIPGAKRMDFDVDTGELQTPVPEITAPARPSPPSTDDAQTQPETPPEEVIPFDDRIQAMLTHLEQNGITTDVAVDYFRAEGWIKQDQDVSNLAPARIAALNTDLLVEQIDKFKSATTE